MRGEIMKLNIKDLKELMTKISLAIEKSKVNPKSGWIEIETVSDKLNFKVSNYDYYLQASVNAEVDNALHVTILADTFIPLVAKLDEDTIDIEEKLNALVITTSSSTYNFPVITELGKTKTLDKIEFNATTSPINVSGVDLATIAYTNANGLMGAIYSKDIQQYIYIDNLGAITFTENIYVNNFANKIDGEFKMLLTSTQARLLEIFSNEENVTMEFEHKPTFNDTPTETNKVCIKSPSAQLILIAQDMSKTESFPSIKLRTLADNPEQTHIVVDKKALDKALARLMVFDKKFDITVLDYSKLVFKENELELISIKNKNVEKIPYISSQNVIEHESMIRFADLVKQLKAITSKEIDISYGSKPAIVINGNIKQLIPEIRVVKAV